MAKPILGCAFLLLIVVGAEAKDPYKILGVDKNASQQEIKKAFHKLSLKYHPDKNASKSAQAKMAELSNAYELLSDEEKRKNYDLTGDESGRAPPESGFPGGGFNGFSGGFHGQNGRPGGGSQKTFYHNFQGGPDMGQYWQFHQNQQQAYTSRRKEEASQGWSGFNFPFDFGSGGGMFDTFFGSAGKKFQNARDSFGGFGGSDSGSGRSKQRKSVELSQTVQRLDSSAFLEKVSGPERDTWLVFFFRPVSTPELDERTSVLNSVAEDLSGIIQVGAVNCQMQSKLCRDNTPSVLHSNSPVLEIYTVPDKSTPYQFTGMWTDKAVKDFVVRNIPNFSTRVDNQKVIQLWTKLLDLPQAVLFTKKKDTPAIWRALSGVFEKRMKFYDMQVESKIDTKIGHQFGIKSFPAVVGMLGNGEDYVLATEKIFAQTGKNMVKELKKFLEDLEKKSKAAGVGMTGPGSEEGVQFLTKANAAVLCGSNTPLCILAFADSKEAQERSKQILTEVSQKTLVRRGLSYESKNPSVSYSMVHSSKQSKFLKSFKGVTVRGSDIVLVAYKPRKGKYAVHKGPFTMEEVEAFVGGVLGGDTTLQTLSGEPVLS